MTVSITPLFTAEEAVAATEDSPVLSDSFDVDGWPITVSQEGLGYTEEIVILRRNQLNDGWVPFRSNGTASLTYNDTAFPINANGTYCLAIYTPPANAISAGYC